MKRYTRLVVCRVLMVGLFLDVVLFQFGCTTIPTFQSGIRVEAMEGLQVSPSNLFPVPNMPDEGSLINVVGSGTGTQTSFAGQTNANGIDDHLNAVTNANWDISVDLEPLDLRCGIQEGEPYVPSQGLVFEAYCLF